MFPMKGILILVSSHLGRLFSLSFHALKKSPDATMTRRMMIHHDLRKSDIAIMAPIAKGILPPGVLLMSSVS